MGGGPDILGGVQCLRVFEEELCTEFLLTKSRELICWKGSCHITSKKRSYGTILRWAKIPRYCIVNNHILFLTSQNWIQPFHSGATSSELCWTNYCVFCTIQTERRVCIGHPTIPWYKEYNKPLFQDPIIYHTRNINHEPCVNPWVCVKELFRKKRHFISSMHLFPNFQIHWTAELQKKQTKHPSSIHPIFPEVLVFLTTNLSSAPPKKKQPTQSAPTCLRRRRSRLGLNLGSSKDGSKDMCPDGNPRGAELGWIIWWVVSHELTLNVGCGFRLIEKNIL